MDLDQKHQEDLKRLQGLRLIDDDFMTKVFEDVPCAELLLQIILNREDLRVLHVHTQQEIKNLQSRSVRMDILAMDETDCMYNVEIQRNDKGAGVKRARYNSSIIDANVTEPGERYEKLVETCVIFITEYDTMKKGLPIYHINRTIEETGDSFGDEAHIIYVNSQIKDDTKLGRLMHDFYCINADDMYHKTLADRVRYFKEDKEGVAIMCRAMEKMRYEAYAETLIKHVEILMLNLKLSLEESCNALNVAPDTYLNAKALLLK